MEYVKFRMDYPIPSCKISKLIWNQEREKWEFEYEIINKSDIKLDQDNKEDLYVYSHISNLTITNKINKGSINIVVHNLDDIIKLMEKQAEEDRAYREKWIKEHPDYHESVLVYETENKSHKPKLRFVISILEQGKDKTKFIMAY